MSSTLLADLAAISPSPQTKKEINNRGAFPPAKTHPYTKTPEPEPFICHRSYYLLS